MDYLFTVLLEQDLCIIKGVFQHHICSQPQANFISWRYLETRGWGEDQLCVALSQKSPLPWHRPALIGGTGSPLSPQPEQCSVNTKRIWKQIWESRTNLLLFSQLGDHCEAALNVRDLENNRQLLIRIDALDVQLSTCDFSFLLREARLPSMNLYFWWIWGKRG